MSNREDNLKKINLELEKLSDEDLEKIAGGTTKETAADSRFLYEHGLVDEWHYTLHTSVYWLSDSKAVDAGWAKAGITCVTKYGPWADNKYFAGSKEITRDEAIAIVKSKFKKIRDAND